MKYNMDFLRKGKLAGVRMVLDKYGKQWFAVPDVLAAFGTNDSLMSIFCSNILSSSFRELFGIAIYKPACFFVGGQPVNIVVRTVLELLGRCSYNNRNIVDYAVREPDASLVDMGFGEHKDHYPLCMHEAVL